MQVRAPIQMRHKMLAILAAVIFALGVSFVASATVADAFAVDGGSANLVAAAENDAAEPFAIITEKLPDAVLGENYESQLEAGGQDAENAKWTKTSGPAWLSVSEDGKISGTNTSSYWSSGQTVKVKAENSLGDSQEKTLTIRSLYKYRQFTGNAKDETVYASISKDGKFLESNGEIPGVLLNYVPIKLADVAAVDLDSFGMGGYKLASDHTGNYAYDVSYMQLFLYMHEHYCAKKVENGFALGDWSSPGGLWVNTFWGIRGAYLTYGLNGQILLDENGSMPTADTVALKNGDDCAMHFYGDSSWYGDSNTADHYFVKDDAVQHEADAFTGIQADFSLVKVYSSVMDPETYAMQSNREPAPDYPFAYGKTYGEAEGGGTTDAEGVAKVTFPEAGTWYLWADGIKGAENPDKVVSAPAMVTVTVADQAAPTITTEILPNAAQNVSYTATLEAEGNPAQFKWALAEGSVLPDGLELSEGGTVSGTPSATGEFAFDVTCSNGIDPIAVKEITLNVIDKYRSLVGTAYVSISVDGKFAVSGGEAAEQTMWRVPIDLAEASSYDLDEHGLGRYNMAAVDEGANYAYEATVLQVMAYVSDMYSATPMSVSGSPTSLLFKSYFGHNQNLNYYVNGAYPLYEGTTIGATADAIAVEDGDDIHVILQPEDDDYGMFLFDPAFGCHYFWDDGDKPIFEYQGMVNEDVQIKLGRSGLDYTDFSTPEFAEGNYAVSFGRSYGEAEGEVITDENGKATIVFPANGTWYVWVDGSSAEEYDDMIGDAPISSAAMAKVVVKSQFDVASEVAEEKLEAAQRAIEEAENAFNAVKSAVDAVKNASDPVAKAKAAAAAVDAAQAAVEKANAAIDAVNQAVEAVQAVVNVAQTDEEKVIASGLQSQTDEMATVANAAKTAADQVKTQADAIKAAAERAATIEVGKTYQVGGMSYKVSKIASDAANGTVSLVKAKNAKSVTVPATVKLADGKTYKVDTIATKAFSNLKKLTKVTIGANVKKIAKSAFFKTPKLKTLIIKSKLLKSKASVKGALKGSKAKKLTVKAPKKLKKAYKKSFKKSNLKAPKKVTVK